MNGRIASVLGNKLILRRGFKTGKPIAASPSQPSSSSSSAGQGSILDVDGSNKITKFYHLTGIALAGLTPVAFILSPSVINMPVDIILGVLFPAHAHVAMNYVVSDYVPKAARSMARMGLLGVTIITAAGLLKLNLTGVGLTETLKSMWRRKERKSKKAAADAHHH